MSKMDDIEMRRIQAKEVDAGLKEVVQKITRRIRNDDLAGRLTDKVMSYFKTKSDKDDLTLNESNLVYRDDQYGDEFKLSKKRNLKIRWTDHAEYRSDLRDINPDKVNQGIVERVKEKLSDKKKRFKLRWKLPGVGTAVVDVRTDEKPALADVITVWASEGRNIKAYSLNVKSTSLKKARAYAEAEMEKAGQNLDEVLPNFDKNYELLQKKMSKAKNISRINMPVIEPSDMALFNKRLNEGAVDIFKPYARGYLPHPTESGGDVPGKQWVSLGFEDGVSGDDAVKGKMSKMSVRDLLPLQGEIWLENMIKPIIKFGPATSGSPILKAPVIVSGDKYILDGHHRFGQAMLANPSLKLNALYIPLKIDKLLEVGKNYGDAIGNAPKASVYASVEEEEIGNKIADRILDKCFDGFDVG